MAQQQGRKAAKNGRVAEQLMRAAEMFARPIRLSDGKIPQDECVIVRPLQMWNVYGFRWRCDYMLQVFRARLWLPDEDGMTRFAIECKNQGVSGSCDEKIPYVIENLTQSPFRNLWIVLTGEQWCSERGAGIVEYIKRKAATLSPKYKRLAVYRENELIGELRRLHKENT